MEDVPAEPKVSSHFNPESPICISVIVKLPTEPVIAIPLNPSAIVGNSK